MTGSLTESNAEILLQTARQCQMGNGATFREFLALAVRDSRGVHIGLRLPWTSVASAKHHGEYDVVENKGCATLRSPNPSGAPTTADSSGSKLDAIMGARA